VRLGWAIIAEIARSAFSFLLFILSTTGTRVRPSPHYARVITAVLALPMHPAR